MKAYSAYLKGWTLGMLLLVLWPAAARSAAVEALVDRTRAAAGETVYLTVKLKGGDGSVDVSAIRDFEVSPEGSHTSVQIVNGDFSRETSYNYALTPLRSGQLKIPPLTVVCDGKTFRSDEIIVQVAQAQSAQHGAEENFVQGHLSEMNPYEGQQIIYTFTLFNSVDVTNAKFRKPDFAGFTAKEAKDPRTYRTVRSGREYQVTEIDFVLIPLQAGTVTIEPAVLSLAVVRRQQRRRNAPFDSIFKDPFFSGHRLESKVYRTEPLTVHVKPLPAVSGATPFSGLVGRFSVHAEVEQSRLKVGDSTTLAITVEGSGNIMDADQPELKVPKAFKVYQDNPEEDIRLENTGFSGRKIFRLALVALKPGSYTLGPVRLNYFEASTGRYEIATSQPIAISASASSTQDASTVLSSTSPQDRSQTQKRKVEFTGRDILPLKTELDALANHTDINPTTYTALLVLPILLFIGVKTLQSVTRNNDEPGRIMTSRAREALKRAADPGAAAEEFLGCLYKAVTSAVFAKSGSRGQALTYAEAEAILVASGSQQNVAGQAARLLEEIESARYSGLSLDASQKTALLSETKQLVRRLCR